MSGSPCTLRPTTASDLPVLFAQQNEPGAAEMVGFTPRDWPAFEAHWTKLIANPELWTQTVEVDGQVAGYVLAYETDGAWEIGYWLGRAFWGRGLATAAAQAFLTLMEARPVRAHVVAHNIGSIRVLEKCGFQHCGIVRGEDGRLDEVVLLLEA